MGYDSIEFIGKFSFSNKEGPKCIQSLFNLKHLKPTPAIPRNTEIIKENPDDLNNSNKDVIKESKKG